MNIDELMRKIHADVARRRPGSAESAPAGFGSLSQDAAASSDAAAPWEPVGARLGFKDTYTVGDFAALNDADFVQTAYRILLRRPADAAGLAAAVADLRQGSRNKVHVLGDIRFSTEGREKCVHVNGLLLPYKIQQWTKRRFLGRPLAWVMAVLRLPTLLARVDAENARGAQEVQNLGTYLNALAQRFDAAAIGSAEHQRQATEQVQTALEGRIVQLQQQLDQLQQQLEGLSARTEQSMGQLGADVNSRMDEMAQAIAPLAARQHHDHAAVAAHLASVDVAVQAVTAAVNSAGAMAADARRIALTLQAASPRLSHDAENSHASPVLAEGTLDALYVGLEDAFRGSREDIKQRVSHYLPLVTEAVDHTNGLPVVDLGCGRGEWLEVLGSAGVHAQGVDLNEVLLAECTGRGFDAVLADALAFLRGKPDRSLAAVTAMHLAEHLDFDVLVGIIDEARRVLAPGGALVLETPNPENLVMSTHWFYFDPTHRNPIPPAFFEWLVQARGFADVRIDRLMENRGIYPVEDLPPEVPGADTLNRMLGMLQAAPDYAVIARSYEHSPLAAQAHEGS